MEVRDIDPALELSNLSVNLGDFKALDGVSACIQQGDFVAVLGPNGAGKTTLLKVVLGLIPHYSGEIRIFGKPLSGVDPDWIGYMPQLKTVDRNFPAVTCDLVASGMRRKWPGFLTGRDHLASEEALDLVGAGHLCHKPLGRLSGGELQRVYLARAIIRKPRLLLLDEPASGIDAVGEDDMYEILEDYLARENTTVIMVTHDWLAAGHHASRVLLINRKLISFGRPDEALDDAHLREAFGHIGHDHDLIPGKNDA